MHSFPNYPQKFLPRGMIWALEFICKNFFREHDKPSNVTFSWEWVCCWVQSSVAETVDNMSGPLSILVLNYPAAPSAGYEGCIVSSANRSGWVKQPDRCESVTSGGPFSPLPVHASKPWENPRMHPSRMIPPSKPWENPTHTWLYSSRW